MLPIPAGDIAQIYLSRCNEAGCGVKVGSGKKLGVRMNSCCLSEEPAGAARHGKPNSEDQVPSPPPASSSLFSVPLSRTRQGEDTRKQGFQNSSPKSENRVYTSWFETERNYFINH